MDRRFTLLNNARVCLYRGRVIASHVALRDGPKASASMDTELLYGQGFDVHAEVGQRLYGRARPLIAGARRRGYVGYISRKAFSSEPVRATHVVTALSAPLFKKSDIKSGIKTTLPMNAQIQAVAHTEHLLEVAGKGFIHRAHIRRVSLDAPQDYAEVAGRFLGRPYIWGGTGAAGVDCSGLVQMALAACDIDAPRDADQQEKKLGKLVDQASLRRGDLVFWPGHVGIMETKSRLLHANAHHMVVAREPLKKAIQRIGSPRSIKRL